jgi:SH3-like domain-containing protein
MRRYRPILLLALLCAGAVDLVSPAQAIEYRSVDTPAILYDAPSQKGVRLFVIRRGTPVEIVVSIEGWAKVRDADGGLAWIEKKSLSERRMLIVSAGRAAVRQAAEDSAALVFDADRGVVLELVEPAAGGWAKVRHAEGKSGFVRASQVWGL